MKPFFLLLQYLLYMNPEIGLQYNYKTENCRVFASHHLIKTCNRVCNSSVPASSEVESIKSFFGTLPFTWAVEANDTKTIKTLEENNLQFKASFPAMFLQFGNAKLHAKTEIKVHEINKQNQDELNKWLEIVSSAFNVSKSELSKVIAKFINQIVPDHLKLYLGYHNEIIASASMAIYHNDVISLHWIGTLPEFRNKGLGYAITYKALEDAQTRSCKAAILLSSALGKPIYERLGFKEYAQYNIYGN